MTGGGERVGLVLSGAAARGPFQAGALTVLVPALRAAGHEPVVLLGTSSGALTTALLAQFTDTGDDAGQHVADVWAGFGPVFANPLYTPALPRLLGRTFATTFTDPVTALLDTGPLRARATELYDPARVRANVAAGRLRTVAVAATTCPTGGAAARSRLFVLGKQLGRALYDPAVDVVEVGDLTVQQLLASAAIPVLFPPEYVPQPKEIRGWYVDGGVRLNAPLDAAIAAGVSRVVVVSGHSAVVPPPPEPVDKGTPPDLAGAVAVSLRAVLTDSLTDDLQSLGRKNRRVACGAAPGYGEVPYLLVDPPDGALADLAAAAFRPRSLPPDTYWVIGRLLDILGEGPGRDELLSLILFDPDYATAQIKMGRERAEQALALGWRLNPP
jgi:NTE family protein